MGKSSKISLDDSLKNFGESNFFEAKKNPGLRQSYIDNKNWKVILPFVEKINYVHNSSGMYLTKSPLFFDIRKKINPQIGITIELHDAAFDNIYTNSELDFLQSMYNRAGYEAYEKYHYSKIRKEHHNIFSPGGGRGIQELLNRIRVDTYALNCFDKKNHYLYAEFLENMIEFSEKELSRQLYSSNKYAPMMFNKESVSEYLHSILENNAPLIGAPLFEL